MFNIPISEPISETAITAIEYTSEKINSINGIMRRIFSLSMDTIKKEFR